MFSNVEEKLCDWFDLVAPPVLWLLSGSALPGHLPLQDGTSNRAKGKRRKNSHHCTLGRVLCISCCVIIFLSNDVTSNRAKGAGWGKLRTNLVLEFISVLQSCRETSMQCQAAPKYTFMYLEFFLQLSYFSTSKV